MHPYISKENPMHDHYQAQGDYLSKHFIWSFRDRVATITLDKPDKKNPLTFSSYLELKNKFIELKQATDIRAVIIQGSGDHFCSGGDVDEIIGPLTKMSAPELLSFARLTGDLVRAMLTCPQPIISVIDGVCAGAGAMIALASNFRLGTQSAKVSFLFNRVGLAGADMGACALLPRTIGHGRATDLLMTGRTMTAAEGLQWGFFNSLHRRTEVKLEAIKLARQLAYGPTFATAITKNMLYQEWSMSLDQAIEVEAQAQSICMNTQDFKRAYDAFVLKQKPSFNGD